MSSRVGAISDVEGLESTIIKRADIRQSSLAVVSLQIENLVNVANPNES